MSKMSQVRESDAGLAVWRFGGELRKECLLPAADRSTTRRTDRKCWFMTALRAAEDMTARIESNAPIKTEAYNTLLLFGD